MFTDNKDFYPTPTSLIEEMISDLNLSMIHTILEPSAGKGDIVKAIKEYKTPASTSMYYNNKSILDIDCIEKEQNLRHILKGNGFRVVHDDFLSYDTMKEYDLIIMNPPFSNGCKHLLKAIEMQKRNGGAIICILNAETLKNQCNNDRILLSRLLKEYNADIKFIKDAFLDAERTTSVEIALIKIKLPETERQSFILDNLKKSSPTKEHDYEYSNTQVAENDYFKSIVHQYNLEIRAGIKLIKEYYSMAPYIMTSFGRDKNTGEVIQTGGCILSLKIDNSSASINEYIREVREKYWKALFENPKFIGKLTDNLKRDYNNKITELRDYDFSLYNIYELKIDMQQKVVKGIEDTIISLFDELSHKHYYFNETSNNIHYYNGWKTNKSWIVNKKVIIPLQAYKDLEFSWGGFKPTHRNVISKLMDIEKCFNYLDGGLTESIDLTSILSSCEKSETTKNIHLKYFNVTFYKKGTCHITFTNEEVLKKFNIFGSQHKGWLPPSYGKKPYSDMSTEEKFVINEFEGESEYNKVLLNRDYYLSHSINEYLLEIKSA